MTDGTKKIRIVVAMSLLGGLVVGAAANHAAEAIFSQHFLNSGLIFLSASEQAVFALSLNDQKDQPAAKVLLQAFDMNGALVARRETTLAPGASTTLRVSGSGVRFHAEALEESLDLTEGRTFVGSVNVFNELTGIIRPSCSVDSYGVGPGR